MIIIPAVDILGSKCVRLAKGDYKDKKNYELTPLEAALNWQNKGAKRLHIVDLDGAKSGKPENFDIIKDIVKSVNIPVEIGGGLRDDETIDGYFNIGASYVIMGSILFKNINSISKSLAKYVGKVIAGLDLIDGKIALSGWTEKIDVNFYDAVNTLYSNYGINKFIFTDINRDGMLKGPNIDFIKECSDICKNVQKIKINTSNLYNENNNINNIQFIASGGISGIDDVIRLKDLYLDNMLGVITGKALYDGRLDLKEAIKVLQ
ncbi:MAG: 1-(5-phosphoribosyl)-5-[(5-phosphoribosylamino)methylideneamino] imidazole-4-carboxamide isomerase [Deltaproteobacteria bacterium]|nr:1-(5-phosphoribosyl)-5-[(5-phosphoribosylamino)methylideneamino] imidazole-4-carboxamide isomerase [Deltaproteobacteria bacterium]